jgi:hypothetical protein
VTQNPSDAFRGSYAGGVTRTRFVGAITRQLFCETQWKITFHSLSPKKIAAIFIHFLQQKNRGDFHSFSPNKIAAIFIHFLLKKSWRFSFTFS